MINKTLTKHNINDIIMLRSPMPKTTYLNQNALGYSAEGVFVLFATKTTTCYAGGKGKALARKEVTK